MVNIAATNFVEIVFVIFLGLVVALGYYLIKCEKNGDTPFQKTEPKKPVDTRIVHLPPVKERGCATPYVNMETKLHGKVSNDFCKIIKSTIDEIRNDDSYSYVNINEYTICDTALLTTFVLTSLPVSYFKYTFKSFLDKFAIDVVEVIYESVDIDIDTLLKMYYNRISYFNDVASSENDNPVVAIIEEFNIILSTDFYYDEYKEFSKNSPLVLWPQGISDDFNCKAEVANIIEKTFSSASSVFK